jgi:hypothetical protein
VAATISSSTVSHAARASSPSSSRWWRKYYADSWTMPTLGDPLLFAGALDGIDAA